MILYSFKIQDTEEIISKWYPMGECPTQIVLQDGRKAFRHYGFANISYGGGVIPQTQADRRRKMMTQKNIDAGKRGEQKGRSKAPKLSKQD